MCSSFSYTCAVNALTFEANAYYYPESRRLVNNQRVVLSQATGAPVFAEMLLESGDGDDAAAGETTVHDVMGFGANQTCATFSLYIRCPFVN